MDLYWLRSVYFVRMYTDLLPCNELVSEYGLDDTGEAMVYLHQTPTAKEEHVASKSLFYCELMSLSLYHNTMKNTDHISYGVPGNGHHVHMQRSWHSNGSYEVLDTRSQSEGNRSISIKLSCRNLEQGNMFWIGVDKVNRSKLCWLVASFVNLSYFSNWK